MRLKFKIAIAMLALIFIFPMKTDADDKYNLFYYSADSQENENLNLYENVFCGSFTVDEKIYILLSNIIDNDKLEVNYIPEDTKLLWVKSKKNGQIIVNFSSEIKNYGGSHYEEHMLKQLLSTVFEVEEVSEVTFLIDERLDCFTEGSIIYKYSKNMFEKDFSDI